jgi:hypothetical protein
MNRTPHLEAEHRHAAITSADASSPAGGHDAHADAHRRSELTALALSATLHCLTGCAIGEVLGMIIGTALGFSDLGTIALAVTLAFLFGYTLTSLPLLRAGLAFASSPRSPSRPIRPASR